MNVTPVSALVIAMGVFGILINGASMLAAANLLHSLRDENGYRRVRVFSRSKIYRSALRLALCLIVVLTIFVEVPLAWFAIVSLIGIDLVSFIEWRTVKRVESMGETEKR